MNASDRPPASQSESVDRWGQSDRGPRSGLPEIHLDQVDDTLSVRAFRVLCRMARQMAEWPAHRHSLSAGPVSPGGPVILHSAIMIIMVLISMTVAAPHYVRLTCYFTIYQSH